MPVFQDNQDREWSINLNVGLLEKIRDDVKVDLGQAYQGEIALQIDMDVITLVRVVFHCCDKQRAERQMTEEDFGCMLVGDTINSAKEALFEALMLFFPTDKREMFRKQMERIRQFWTEMEKELDSRVTPEAMRKIISAGLQNSIDQAMQNFGSDSGMPLTEQPESSA